MRAFVFVVAWLGNLGDVGEPFARFRFLGLGALFLPENFGQVPVLGLVALVDGQLLVPTELLLEGGRLIRRVGYNTLCPGVALTL